jgi:hypothetical protein
MENIIEISKNRKFLLKREDQIMSFGAFISYSWKNETTKDWARDVYRRLSNRPVFIDFHGCPAMSIPTFISSEERNLRQLYTNAIDQFNYFVAFVDNEYLESENCKNEFQYAESTGRKVIIIKTAADEMEFKNFNPFSSSLVARLSGDLFLDLFTAAHTSEVAHTLERILLEQELLNTKQSLEQELLYRKQKLDQELSKQKVTLNHQRYYIVGLLVAVIVLIIFLLLLFNFAQSVEKLNKCEEELKFLYLENGGLNKEVSNIFWQRLTFFMAPFALRQVACLIYNAFCSVTPTRNFPAIK